MAKLNLGEKLNINQCAKLIMTVGQEITIIIRSEPGCGKSSILDMLHEAYGDKYDYIYCDCPVKDLSDVAMNIPVHDSHQLECYVAEIFKTTSKKPKIIMLDEFLKSSKMLQIIWMRLCLERVIGDVPLPTGSIVFGTSNNSSDGVGDTMLAHGGNRVMLVNMKKPNAKEWGLWATDHDVSALTRAWVAMNPAAMNSYTEMTDTELSQNPYIFNPKKLTLSFVSPRSLYKNDVLVRNKGVLGDDIVKAGMAGTVGEAAAESLSAFFLIERDLMPFSAIINAPESCPVPTNIGALLMILFNAVDEIGNQDELSLFMKFVLRLKSVEMQSVFFTMACQSKKTVKLTKNNKYLSDWMCKNFQLFT